MKAINYYIVRRKKNTLHFHHTLSSENCCLDVNVEGRGERGKDSNMINAHEFLGHHENCPRICLFNLYSDLKD